jgi:hypothetical protein
MEANDKTSPAVTDIVTSPPVFQMNKFTITGITKEILFAKEVGAIPFFTVEYPDNRNVITKPIPIPIIPME